MESRLPGPVEKRSPWVWERGEALFAAYERALILAPAAIYRQTGYALGEVLKGLLPGLIEMLVIVVATTTIGAAAGGVIGFFFGGAGAAPGAVVGGELGFDVGLAALTWLGVAFLAVAMVQGAAGIWNRVSLGVKQAWEAPEYPDREYPSQIERAAAQLADAAGMLMLLLLQAVVAWVLKRAAMGATQSALRTAGAAKTIGSEAAADAAVGELVSKLRASKLGGDFATWVEDNWPKLRDDPRLRMRPTRGATAELLPEKAPGSSAAPERDTAQTPASRRATAEAFYKQTGWPDEKIASHMAGIDFSKPVDVVTLPKGTQVVQYQIPGSPTGQYFAPMGTPAESIGVNPAGRVASTYTATSDVSVLQSTAASTDSNLSLPPSVRGTGGGTQYFAPDNSAFGQ
jgi:hypothetical protein